MLPKCYRKPPVGLHGLWPGLVYHYLVGWVGLTNLAATFFTMRGPMECAHSLVRTGTAARMPGYGRPVTLPTVVALLVISVSVPRYIFSISLFS